MTELIKKLLESKFYIITFAISLFLILLALLEKIPSQNDSITFRHNFDFSSITILLLGIILMIISAYLVYLYEFKTVRIDKAGDINISINGQSKTVEGKTTSSGNIGNQQSDKSQDSNITESEKEINKINRIYNNLSRTQKMILKKVYSYNSQEVLEKHLYNNFTKDYEGLIGNEDEFHFRLKDLMSQEIKLIQVKSIGEKTSTIVKFESVKKLLIRADIIKTDS